MASRACTLLSPFHRVLLYASIQALALLREAVMSVTPAVCHVWSLEDGCTSDNGPGCRSVCPCFWGGGQHSLCFVH
ncbi:MAG: hypothetical protein J3Q66DRAFT_358795, partial [Benniella sp.]